MNDKQLMIGVYTFAAVFWGYKAYANRIPNASAYPLDYDNGAFSGVDILDE